MPVPALVYYAAFYIVTSALSYLLVRRAAGRVHQAEPPEAGQLEPPDAKESGPVPVVFGSVWLSPNVCWYGDLRTEPIKQCQSARASLVATVSGTTDRYLDGGSASATYLIADIVYAGAAASAFGTGFDGGGADG